MWDVVGLGFQIGFALFSHFEREMQVNESRYQSFNFNEY